jgi:tripartite ATP-independent transporter DctM subunit
MFIIVLLFVFILLGMPIGFSIMISALIAMFVFDISLITAPIQMFSGTNSLVLLAIPLFILMGELMSVTNIASKIISFASSIVGWIRGGLSHVNVLTSMFMAEMSGSAVADAAIMSKIFVPEMVKKGYSKFFSASITASSATLGIIIPPSIPMILYGVSTNTSIKDLFIAGIVPGILLGVGFMITNYIFAVKENYPVDEKFEIIRLGSTFKAALFPLTIPIIVVGGLIVGIITPTEAAATGVLLAFLFGLSQKVDLMSKMPEVLGNSVRQTATVMMIIAGSAILGQFLANEQLPQIISQKIIEISDNRIIVLLCINLFLLLLGMFLHATAAIIIVVPILLPLAVSLGLDPVHFGVIVCLNLGIGQQTPPVASVLLTVCSTTGTKIEEVMKYSKWFITTMFITLLIVTFVPQTAIWFK